MRATLKYALIFSGISILAKLILWNLGLLENDATLTFKIYILALLISIFLGLSETKDKEQTSPTSLGHDIKTSLQSVVVYALIMSFFTYIFYKFIDWEFMYERIAERMEAAEAFELTSESNIHNKTRDEFLEGERTFAEFAFSAHWYATITLAGFMIIGSISAALISFLIRKNPKYKTA
jgi:hypothetical protein